MNNKAKKRITIRLGGVGGIGGVVLFVGGALVTAAFASAFVLKRRRRRSDEERRVEIEKPRGENGKDEVEGHQIHISSDTSLGGDQSEEETERVDSSTLVSTHSSIKDGTENRVEVPSFDVGKGETLISQTLRKPENDVILSDSLLIKEGSILYEESSLALENPEKIQSVIDEDFASEVRKEETDEDSKLVLVDDEILETKDKEVNEENIKIVYCDDEEVNAEEDNSAVTPDVENIEPQKYENVEKTKLEESIGDNVGLDAKKHDEITGQKEDIGYIHGSLSETKSVIEDEHESITIDVILENSVVCESEDKAGDLHHVSHQEDIADINATVSKLENNRKDRIEPYVDETEEIESEEISDGSADSSLESNSDAVCPTEESSMEPQINDREVRGKMQEDKAVKETDLKQSTNIKAPGNNYEDSSISSTKRRMLVAMLLMLSSVSGSWFFGLSMVELCLIAFLTMVLSELNAC